ncbi:MAG TPA: helix-turn-helix transcriptional regulator [Coleofasciculaceae cyanobacterium]
MSVATLEQSNPAVRHTRGVNGAFVLEIEADTFPKWLLVCRTAMGISQAEVAQKLNVSYQLITHWESGYRTARITSERLAILCQIFQCEPNQVPRQNANFVNC